jgi:phosphohistidine phosphatase
VAARARTRRILLLRHAKSSWDDPTLEDRERPLAPRGRRAAKRMARVVAEQLAAEEPAPLVLCSPARRARETLAPLAERLPEGARVRMEAGLYMASAGRLLARLQRLPASARVVLVIGHDPGLHELANALVRPGRTAAHARLRDKLPTGALVSLETRLSRWSALAPGSARLAAFTRPRDLD